MSTGGWIRPITRLAVMLRDAEGCIPLADGSAAPLLRCVYCEAPFSRAVLTLDHIHPTHPNGGLKWGGTARGRADNRPSNLITACLECNQVKARDDVTALCARRGLPAGPVRARVQRCRRRRLTRARGQARALLGAPPLWLRWMFAAHATVRDRQTPWGQPAEVLPTPLATLACPWCDDQTGDALLPCPGCLVGHLDGLDEDRLPPPAPAWRLTN